MRLIAVLDAATFAAAPAAAQNRSLDPDLQIRLAVQAAPEALREGATVQGYDAQGRFVTLRTGTNDLICMAPDPSAEQFEVSCHPSALEPFLARGRALKAQGITGEARIRRRWTEMAAGRLQLPYGTVNTILNGSGFDSTTATVQDPRYRYVIYVPNATPASTGLPEAPTTAGAPWLMFPGTQGAHIMISPPPRP